MQREELVELHYITPIANVSSIMRLGILSHNRAKRVEHQSVAMNEIQDRRAKVTVPGGRKLHEYVNLYICARNPMMYKRQAQFMDLCVLRVSPGVIDLPGVVITDSNASGDYVRFSAAPRGLAIVDRDWTFADDWRDPDPIQYFRKKAAKCAEVLVPDRVKPYYITGAYVSCQEAGTALERLGTGLAVEINSNLFFR
ncbi:MAG: DUF4433 domain-containing protein [Syntrophobacterales bacterium]|nr:DUF4433 domain-containing protein [Syntrophobacterales bacterium]